MNCCGDTIPFGATGIRFEHKFLKCDGGPYELEDDAEVEFVFVKGATRVVRTGVVQLPATGGIVYYVTSAGDITSAGTWQWQARVSLSGGRERLSQVFTQSFSVSL